MDKKGQGVIEYCVIFVVIVAIMLVMVPKILKPHINEVYNGEATALDQSFGVLDRGIGSSPSLNAPPAVNTSAPTNAVVP